MPPTVNDPPTDTDHLERIIFPIPDNSSDHFRPEMPIMGLMEALYAVSEVVVAIFSILGNSLIIASFLRNPHLRKPTNLYIFSLALADLLVSVVGIPIYLYSMITSLPSDFLACLIVNTWIMMLCTVSIFHLVSLSFDRYMAIVWLRQPDSRKERMRQATFSIATAWICGTVVGFLPLMGWNRGPSPRGVCDFMEIMDMSYLMFLFYFTIITPTFLMAFFYVSIFHVVQRQDRRMARRSYGESETSDRDIVSVQLKSLNGVSRPKRPSVRTREKNGDRRYLTVDDSRFSRSSDENSLHRRPTIEKKDILKKKANKSKKVVMSFVWVIASFLTSWYPLYILNAITYYAPDFPIDQAAFYACIVLSHLSTTVNPLIYARTMPGFRDVLIETLRCEKVGSRRRRQLSFNNSVSNIVDGI